MDMKNKDKFFEYLDSINSPMPFSTRLKKGMDNRGSNSLESRKTDARRQTPPHSKRKK
jgi:hypothetical protein